MDENTYRALMGELVARGYSEAGDSPLGTLTLARDDLRDTSLAELADRLICRREELARSGQGQDAALAVEAVKAVIGRMVVGDSGPSRETGPRAWVWVFNGAKAWFPAGVFTTRDSAEAWIRENDFFGTLTEYPLDIGCFDWAVQEGHFTPTRPWHDKAGWKQRFTSQIQRHYHYGPVDPDPDGEPS